MTKEQVSQIVQLLANAPVYFSNTSLTITTQESSIEDYYFGTIDVSPGNGENAFNSRQLELLLGLKVFFPIVVTFNTVDGVCIAHIY